MLLLVVIQKYYLWAGSHLKPLKYIIIYLYCIILYTNDCLRYKFFLYKMIIEFNLNPE